VSAAILFIYFAAGSFSLTHVLTGTKTLMLQWPMENHHVWH